MFPAFQTGSGGTPEPGKITKITPFISMFILKFFPNLTLNRGEARSDKDLKEMTHG